ncbi:PA14 domain-containing protein [uncultured Proteiniphilum sp.]|uniref:PA14 domain-containing protein n=1 Tax=uncultured Proteiniphilum sp. TaxID=497637 RepID=UPI00260D58C9|nr:PA14 domain-containing protein [uncultured Proteiniphilum sp.]
MKKYIAILLILLVCSGMVHTFGQDNIRFGFDKNGQFKIAQFTDLHWDNKSPGCAETVEVIKYVLSIENPDLAMLTGDIITAPPAREGWLSVARIFEEAKMPWAVVLGNHDDETGVTREEVFDIIENLPYFVGEKGEKMTGCGNYTLPIMSSDGTKIASVLYCLDSNNKPAAHKYGHYDWIHADQIDWYRKTSAAYTANNNNQPLPSLAFFHIPILEFNNIVGKETTVGIQKEGVASPEINSGLFCSFIEKKDMMGVFVGHDHDNDYIGIDYDIALGFGRTTGIDAYGILERGSRIINLYENKFRFDTWIRTRKGTAFAYYFPSGLSSVDEESMAFLPAQTSIGKEAQGISYTYYEGGRLKKIAEIETNAKKIKEGTIENFSLDPAVTVDSFALVFKGLIDIPERGVYRFYTYSDDGSRLSIDNQVVVDNDGSHNARRVDGKVALEAGLHELEVIYFEDYMGEVLEVGWSSRSIREEQIPDEVLFVSE